MSLLPKTKKPIILELSKEGAFFSRLKEILLEEKEFKDGHKIAPYIDMVINSLVKTFKNVAKEQGQPESGEVKIKILKVFTSLPQFFDKMVEDIEYKSDYNITKRTARRYADFTTDLLHEVADKQAKEKMNIPKFIDPEKEFNLIKNYIIQTWNGFNKVESDSFFEYIWSSCMQQTQSNFNEYGFTDFIKTWDEERKDYDNWKDVESPITKANFINELSKDEVVKLPAQILIKQMHLRNMLNKNLRYDDVVEELVSEVKAMFPDASKLRPKGWNALKKTYNDFDGMEEFDSEKAKKEFGGMNSGTAGSYPFEIRVSLPYVMYDHISGSEKALNVLVGAIYAHAYALNANNNTSEMLTELSKLKDKYDQPEYYKTPVTEIDFEFKVPLNQELFYMIAKDNPNVLKNNPQIQHMIKYDTIEIDHNRKHNKF